MESPTMRRSEDEKKSSKFDTRIEMSEEGKEDMSSSLSNHAKRAISPVLELTKKRSPFKRKFSMKERMRKKTGKKNLGGRRGRSCNGRLPMWIPTQPWRRAWDIFLFLVLFYSCLYIPYEIGFDIHIGIGSFMYVFNILVDVYFCVDCAMNFNVAIVKKDGEIITNPQIVRKMYFRGWFFLDLITSIPFGALVDLFTGGTYRPSTFFHLLYNLVPLTRT